MPTPSAYDSTSSLFVHRDEEHLRLLGIYHGLMAACTLLLLVVFVLLPLLIGPTYMAWVHLPMNLPPAQLQQRLLLSLLLGGLATLIYGLNGWELYHRRHRLSCILLSCIECVSFPMGMILGVSAILVLRRESVKALFQANAFRSN